MSRTSPSARWKRLRCQSVTCQNCIAVPLPALGSAAGCCCSVVGSVRSGGARDAAGLGTPCEGDGGGSGDSSR